MNPALLLAVDEGMMSSLFDTGMVTSNQSHDLHLTFDPPGLAALKLPEQPTVAAASSFFLAFLGLSGSVGAVAEVVGVNGKLLVQAVLQAVAWAAPRSYVASFSDILGSLQANCVTLLSQWLAVSGGASLSQCPFS